jgi:invasion protein IalB
VLVVTLPFGADFRPGIIVRVDEGPEYRGEFVTCSELGCRAVLELNEELRAALVNGEVLQLGMRPYGTTQTAAIQAPLDGSAAALRHVFP